MTALGLTSLLTVPAAPTTVNASSFGTASNSVIQINFPAAVMKQAACANKNGPGVSALSRAGIFARGVESQEGQPETPQQQDAQLEDKTPEIAEPVVVTLDRPLHVVTATGEAVVLTPGTYEIRPVLDVQLGLAREGHPTVLLHAHRGTHNESIPRAMAMAVPSEVDQVHIVIITSDGRRFDAQASGLGVMSWGTGTEATLADKPLDDALKAASARPSSPV